jgi:hypothetical protein
MSDAPRLQAERELPDLELRRISAINSNDPIALELLLTDDYVHVHASGAVQTRAELIYYTVSNPRTTEPRAPAIRVFDDVAVLTGELSMKWVRDGKVIVNHLYVTQVACKIESTWKYVSFQATHLSHEI